MVFSINPTFNDTPVNADSLRIEIDEKTGVIVWTLNNALVGNVYELNPTVTDRDELFPVGKLNLTITINDDSCNRTYRCK